MRSPFGASRVSPCSVRPALSSLGFPALGAPSWILSLEGRSLETEGFTQRPEIIWSDCQIGEKAVSRVTETSRSRVLPA